MSCCSDCQHGLGCDGLGALPVAQVGALEHYVVAESVIEWGGYVFLPGRPNDRDISAGWGDDIEAAIKNALWNHGGFSMVDAGRISGFWNSYIGIRVTTQIDFAKLGDVLVTIEGAIYAAGFRPDTQNFWVLSVPASAQQREGVAQPNAGAGNKPDSGGFPSISLPNLRNIFGGGNDDKKTNCWQTTTGWQDYLACELGITRTNAVLIGAGVALLAVVLVKKGVR